MTRQWSCSELKRLGPVIDVPTAASILDISEWKAYEMIRSGEWETALTPVLRLGRKIKIPTVRLIALLCDDTATATGTGTGTGTGTDIAVDAAAGGSQGRGGRRSRDGAAS